MIRILIVENEPAPAELLISQLKKCFSDIEILEVCENVQSSLHAIKTYTPDLVFMDVELNNNEKGFDILKNLHKVDFELIVTTSFDKYAMQACKASALDFLEKPFTDDELIKAVNKYRDRSRLAIDSKQIELVLALYQKQILKIAMPTMNGLDYLETNDIIYFEALNTQSKVCLFNKPSVVTNLTLKECTAILSDSGFYRIHKSWLVNLKHVKRYVKGKGGTLLLNGTDAELPVSREAKDDFLKCLRGGER